MVNFPKKGMLYEQAKRTCIRHVKEGSAGTVNSMINQVALAEGPKAAAEFRDEVLSKGNEQRARERKFF